MTSRERLWRKFSFFNVLQRQRTIRCSMCEFSLPKSDFVVKQRRVYCVVCAQATNRSEKNLRKSRT